jgi:hypothetical protein
MFEDIISTPATPTIPQQPTKKGPRPFPKKPKVERSPFEVVREVNDIKMLAKILDLCKSKIRKKKRKARKERKQRAKLSRRKY